MSDYTTSHYDIDHESIGKSMLILDTIRNLTMAIDNDALPASREDPVTMGTDNIASTLGSDSNTIFTTIPLRPLSQDVNFLAENYLTYNFNYSIDYIVESIDDDDDPNYVLLNNKVLSQELGLGMISSSCTPSRIQLMLGNSIIWSNTYQRQEALATMASLPQNIVDNDPEYITPNKLKNGEIGPGAKFKLEFHTRSDGKIIARVNVNTKYNNDLSHLTALLSNIYFLSSEMGDIKLRLYFEKMDSALSLFVFPPTGPVDFENDPYFPGCTIENYPLKKPLEFLFNKSRFKLIPSSFAWKAINQGVTITQCNFRLQEGSKAALRNYIGQDNRLVFPTQTWSTVISNEQIAYNSGQGGINTFQIPAYNIYLLAFLFPFNGDFETYYPNPLFSNINIQLNSKSINYQPYEYADSRLIKDTVQAFLNDDKNSANTCLLDSLRLSGSNDEYIAINPNAEPRDRVNSPPNFKYPVNFADIYNKTSDTFTFNHYLNRPNQFIIAKGLSPPNSFEKGYCVASQNPQSTQIRITYTQPQKRTTPPSIGTVDYSSVFMGDNVNAPGFCGENDLTFSTQRYPAYCLALQDCCLVLGYNPSVNTCQTGEIVYMEPFIA